jgi:hypothetical protein
MALESASAIQDSASLPLVALRHAAEIHLWRPDRRMIVLLQTLIGAAVQSRRSEHVSRAIAGREPHETQHRNGKIVDTEIGVRQW